MAEHDSDVDELDARLAEVDRRLSAIQDELRSEAGHRHQARDFPGPERDAAATGSYSSVAELQTRLLAALQELLGAYESLLVGRGARRAVGAAAGPSGRRPDPSPQQLVVTAGPFASTDRLRAFEQALSALPGVRSVSVREYAGEDRAIVDVRLGDPTS
jgi:hypothetical protein